jgi:hypothetical protein
MGQGWEEAYRAAVLETDHYRLAAKVDLATAALQDRLLKLASDEKRDRERQQIAAERHQIMDGLRTLEMIRRTELDIPAGQLPR